MPLKAGRYRQRVRFERQLDAPLDEMGNPPGQWLSLGEVWADFKPEYGRETVAAGRLQSTVKGVLTVRFSILSSVITAADRVVFIRSPYAEQPAQIRSVTPMTDRREIEMTLELGVAQ